MNIEDMTVKQVREITSLFGESGAKPCPFKPGQSYMIRTVTMTWTGRVQRVEGDFLVMSDAAWIASTGRYADATTIDALSEVEPIKGEAIIGLGAVVDARAWSGELLSVQK